ncbi:alpha/beta fold hydrolase [Promicromonospora iranensis]|uniref:alpha/beta fold hydrolase n=1 Tax=Promicromonospora iranensis TaxID=1105144 RepID=UPI0023A94E71|nr:alpha/beta hydrolase [Promicromonospora iranensis]
MTANSPIVLIGGGGLGPWAWERVAPILNDHGLHTMTPQLRTTGDDATSAAGVGLDDWVEDVSGALTGHRDATLVAHSFAGYVAAAVLERRPHSIRQLVLIDAVLPRPGKSWFDVMGSDVATFMTSLAHEGSIPWFSREQLDQLYPDNSIGDADFAWMQQHLTAQPIGTYTQPAINKPLSATDASVAYVRCLRTSPPAADVSAEQLGWRYRTLDAGHWPMITHPAETAHVIMDLAA